MTIDKRMSSGGPETKQMNMKTFIELADKEKIEADALNDLFEAVQEKFLEQRKPGESFNSWINRADVEELRRIKLTDGGKVLDFGKYKKSKNPKVKEIDLASSFPPNTAVSDLSEKDKATVLMLLKMSGIGKQD